LVVAEEEEGRIFDYWSADGSTKLITHVLRLKRDPR
jgi:hypothetical protein